MSGGFTVQGQAIDDLGTAFGGASTALTGLDVAGPLTAAGAALPGSQIEVATSGVAVKLAAAVRVVGEHIDQMAGTAHATAATYRTADSTVQRRFGPVGVR